MKYRCIDIFCGAGGLSYGFSFSDCFEIIMANDCNTDAVKTYKTNHPSVLMRCCDIAEIKEEELLELGRVDIVIGGPPCQSYSTLGKRQMDDKATLFWEYIRILSILKPKIFIFENVVGLLSMLKGKLFETICRAFDDLGYRVSYSKLNAADFGVPQNRERIFIVGCKKSIGNKHFVFPSQKTKTKVSLREAIGDLPEIESGEDGNNKNFLFEANNDFLKFVRKQKILTEHTSPQNNSNLCSIMRMLKDGEGREDLPISIRPKSGYANTYAKMWWEAPAPTITRNFSTPSSSRCIHPRDSRALSIREGARLQSFPDDYVFCGSDTAKRLQIGNAVPPLVSIALAESVREFLFLNL
ncbi:DNA cytosine methyltransferase [Helicobacter anatolicus]|uniref:DNA cytosine methyltransferase n=1 Tax=Helicobacter anatolicus TaxID=2905874 RepID=UPI001E64C134|nr:DNA cytosine methyltransferase [Helicobacter anatolicus]MCE3040298.1 DNA cytosine methyltransferase [Helicobacter anatolicus]